MKYIIAIGIFQALAASVLLGRSKVRNHADGLLIALLVCIGLHLSMKFFIFSFVEDIQVRTMMNTFIGFCYLPLLYLYTLKIARPEFVPGSKWFVFIPFIIAAIAFFSVASVIAAGAWSGYLVLEWYNTITLYTMIPMDIVLACWIINFARKRLDVKSDERTLILQLASLFLSIGVLGILFLLAKPFGFDYNYMARSIIYSLLVVICIRILIYKYATLIQFPAQTVEEHSTVIEDVSVGAELHHKLVQEVNRTKDFNATTALSERKRDRLPDHEMMSILLKLESTMVSEKYYTDSELTLDKLASLTQQNKYHISQTLNHFLHKPFYTFVNEYRVNQVKEQMMYLSKKDIEINILSLAFDAGFNSKSSFNRYFKEMVGQTPTAYYRNCWSRFEISTCGTADL